MVLGVGLCLALLAGMGWLDRALKTPAAPAGILSFELAGSMAQAERILASWDGPARIRAGISLGLDFFFLVVYAATLARGCRMVAAHWPSDRRGPRIAGGVLANAQWVAAFLDTVENLALIQLLLGRGHSWLAVLAALCAWPKFGLVGGALLYLLAGCAAILGSRFRRP